MSGEKAPQAQDIGRFGGRLRLVPSGDGRSGDSAAGGERGVDYSRKPLDGSLNIVPPVLSRSGEQNHRVTVSRMVKRISTVTPSEGTEVRGAARQEATGREAVERTSHRRSALRESRDRQRRENREKLYRRRRSAAIVLGVAAAIAVVMIVALIYFGSGDRVDDTAISPDAPAGTEFASVQGLRMAVPVRPQELNGFGYHAEGEGYAEISPEVRNLGSVFSVLPFGKDPNGIGYYIMSAEGRGGSDTGAVDVGAEAGTRVYSPVTGLVTSIKPDPRISEASIIEIQPAENPNLRVYVTLVGTGEGDAGVKSPVEAGETSLGTVVDSASVLDTQLAGYTGESGDHVTVFAARVG